MEEKNKKIRMDFFIFTYTRVGERPTHLTHFQKPQQNCGFPKILSDTFLALCRHRLTQGREGSKKEEQTETTAYPRHIYNETTPPSSGSSV
jgi:hypothetical protein